MAKIPSSASPSHVPVFSIFAKTMLWAAAALTLIFVALTVLVEVLDHELDRAGQDHADPGAAARQVFGIGRGNSLHRITIEPKLDAQHHDLPAAAVAVTICGHGPALCRPGVAHSVTFSLHHIFHFDRQAGTDSYDFIFVPRNNTNPLGSELYFVYRSNPSGAFHAAVLTALPSGYDLGFPTDGDHYISGVSGFGDSRLATLLDKKTTPKGVRWGNVAGVPNTTSRTGFLSERAPSDDLLTSVGSHASDPTIKRWLGAASKVGTGMLDVGAVAFQVLFVLSALVGIVGGLMALRARDRRAVEAEETGPGSETPNATCSTARGGSQRKPS